MDDADETSVPTSSMQSQVATSPALEAARGAGPAWEGRDISRSMESVEVGGQEPASSIPAHGEASRTKSTQKSDDTPTPESDRQTPDETESGSPSREVADGHCAKRIGRSEANEAGQMLCAIPRTPRSNGREVVASRPRETIVDGIGAESLADPSLLHDWVGNALEGDTRYLEQPKGCLRTEDVECPTTLPIEEESAVATLSSIDERNTKRDSFESEEKPTLTGEGSLWDSTTGGFQELLEEAVRQSDAERARDKEAAYILRRRESLSLVQDAPTSQPTIVQGTSHSVPVTANGSDSCCDNMPDRISTEYAGSDAVSASIDSPVSSRSSPAPEPGDIEGQWVRYVSPDGYPYLYNEVTGDSKWDAEAENVTLQAGRPPATEIGRSGVGTEQDRKGAVYNADEGRVHVEHVAGVKTAGMGGSSEGTDAVWTCNVLQASKETSDTDARNSAGQTAMHLAATHHSLRGLSLLLAAGANVNAADDRGRTPLHMACESYQGGGNNGNGDQSHDCVELLLASGASQNARDASGQTPLHLSALVGNLAVAQALLAAGATVSADTAGNSPLHLAAAQGHSEIIQLLVLGKRADGEVEASFSPPSGSSRATMKQDEEARSRISTDVSTPRTAARERLEGTRHLASNDITLVDRSHLRKDRVDGSALMDNQSFNTAYEAADRPTYYGETTRGPSSPESPSFLGVQTRRHTGVLSDTEDTQQTAVVNMSTSSYRSVDLPVLGSEPGSNAAGGDGNPMAAASLSDYRDFTAGERMTHAVREGTEQAVPGCDSDGRYEGLGLPTAMEHLTTTRVSHKRDAARRRWSEGSDAKTPPSCPGEHLRQGEDHTRANQYGQGNLGTRNWSLNNARLDKRKTGPSDGDEVRLDEESLEAGEGEEGNLDVGRDGHPERELTCRRSERKGDRRGRRKHRHHGRDPDNRTCPWPEALSQDEYEQTVRPVVLAAEGEGPDVPSHSALAAALFAACAASRPGDAAAVLFLMGGLGSGGAGVKDEGGRTPLHHACRGDDVDLVRLLCRARADPEARDYQGNSPVMVAASTGSNECLCFLLHGGADPNGCNEVGDTPLHAAVWHGNLSCVKALVGSGARLGQRNKLGFTPREGLLHAGPIFTRGRRPKALRTTLMYMEQAEESAAPLQPEAWALEDDRGSEFSAATTAPLHSPENAQYYPRAFDAPADRASAGRQGQLVDRSASGPLSRDVDHTRPSLGEQKRERHWGRSEPFDGGVGVVREGCSEDTESSGGNRRGRHKRASETGERYARDGRTNPADQARTGYPQGNSSDTGYPYHDHRPIHHTVAPLDRSYTEHSPEDEGARERQITGKMHLGSGRRDSSRGSGPTPVVYTAHDRNSGAREPHNARSAEEPPVEAGAPSRTGGGGLWGLFGRAFDSFVGGGGDRGCGDTGDPGPEPEVESRAIDQPSADHPSRRPPTDNELRARRIRSLSSKEKSRAVLEAGSVGAARGDMASDAQQLDSPPTTESVTTRIPLSLTPMQPPPDVLAAMQGRAAAGPRRQVFSSPPADVAAALDRAMERRKHDRDVHRSEDNRSGSEHDAGTEARETGGARRDGMEEDRSSARLKRNSHQAEEAQTELGPFSLAGAGKLGKLMGRDDPSGRSMYVDFFDERQRQHREGGGDGV